MVGDTDGAAMDGTMFDTARAICAFSVYSEKLVSSKRKVRISQKTELQ
jgi:hypothetical protein